MEIERINGLFKNRYNGNPWLDITLAGTLQNISAARAAQKKYPERNSIWEITNHLVHWRETVLQRVQGETVESPPHNFFLPVNDISEIAWQQTLQHLNESQQQWEDFLNQVNGSILPTMYQPNNHSYYEHIHGIIQHDAYHLGQIVMLAKHPE